MWVNKHPEMKMWDFNGWTEGKRGGEGEGGNVKFTPVPKAFTIALSQTYLGDSQFPKLHNNFRVHEHWFEYADFISEQCHWSSGLKLICFAFSLHQRDPGGFKFSLFIGLLNQYVLSNTQDQLHKTVLNFSFCCCFSSSVYLREGTRLNMCFSGTGPHWKTLTVMVRASLGQ